LEFASNNQKMNFGIVMAALRQNQSAIQYVSRELIIDVVTQYH